MHFLIVGAGFSGIVTAHQLSKAGHRCTIVDKRDHIAGNAYDTYDAHGVLIHPYGPHYFRSNSQRVVDYLSKFTEWTNANYQIRSFTKEKFWSFPINLHTFEQLIGRPATEETFKQYLAEKRHHIPDPKNSEELILSKVGSELYELFFEGYTVKQWNRHPRDLSPSVCGRIPIRTTRDDRYLNESFQSLPSKGYTALFESILADSPRVTVKLGIDFAEANRTIPHDHLVFTGPIDQYFNQKYGALPYRSLKFEHQSFSAEQLAARQDVEFKGSDQFFQPYLQVNYPSANVPQTRIVEIKHVTQQKISATSISKEFPLDWHHDREPYYPVPCPDSTSLYKKYAMLAEKESKTTFIGRLAKYRYYNMDQVIAMALTTSDKLIKRFKTTDNTQ